MFEDFCIEFSKMVLSKFHSTLIATLFDAGASLILISSQTLFFRLRFWEVGLFFAATGIVLNLCLILLGVGNYFIHKRGTELQEVNDELLSQIR